MLSYAHRRHMHGVAHLLLGASLSCIMWFTPAKAAGSHCKTALVHEAFDIQRLKSELMVTALSCGSQDRYNQFVTKFRPKLEMEETRLKRYFHHAYGRNAQHAHDDYITQLANVQSEGGLKAGTIFCMQRVSMFDETDALDDETDLARYAAAKDIASPNTYDSCDTQTKPQPRRSHRRARRHKT